jgi:hypothetical protein
VQAQIGDEQLDGSGREAIVGGPKIGDRFDVRIHIEYAEQHLEIRALGLGD